MKKIIIDYRDSNAKQKIITSLDRWIESDQSKKLELQIIHIVSDDFENDFKNKFTMDEVTDFNGWQCDWWNEMEYRNYAFDLYGEAWYGRIRISS